MKEDEVFGEEPFMIKVKYHDGASKLGSDIHGVMCDLAASETVVLKKGEKKIIPLGVSMKLPDGYFGLVVPRSSTCINCGIAMGNSVGIIENDYCGENDVWGFVAIALEDTTIEAGTRIAQFMPVAMHNWATTRFGEPEEWPYPNRGGYGSTGEKAGKHVLDCNGNPIYAGSYVHMKYCNKTKRVAQVFAEGEAFELKNGTVINERKSGKSEKILYQDGGWDRATSVYVVNGTMSDALEAISCLERGNKRLNAENEHLKAEIERLKSEVPDDCMRLPLDANGVPIRIGDEMWLQPNEGGEPLKRTVVGYRASTSMGLTCFIGLPDKLGNTETCVSYLWSHKKTEPADSWEKLEEDAKMVNACNYAHAPRDEYGITVCRDCRFYKSKSCRQGMILDMIARAKKLLGVEEQEGGERIAMADKEER